MTTLFLSGDVMTGRGINQILAHPVGPELHEPYVTDARQYVRLAEQKHGDLRTPVEDDYVWGFALKALWEADPAARIINLETAVTTSDSFWKGKGVHYRMSPRNIGCLKAAKPDCCTLANNHVLDWGYAGLSETLDCLERAGLKTAGAGPDEDAAWKPAVLPIRAGGRLLVFSLAGPDSGVPPAWNAVEGRPGVALLPNYSEEAFAKTAETITRARRDDSDLVVLSIHWGGNWGYDVPDEHRRFAHRWIDEAGVDVVHGHSSHHVKGIEVHGGRLILYGCGDLITDYEGISGHETFRGDLGLLYFADLDPATGRLNGLRVQPTQMRQMRLSRPSEEDVAWMQNMLDREGRRFNTSMHPEQEGALHLEWD